MRRVRYIATLLLTLSAAQPLPAQFARGEHVGLHQPSAGSARHVPQFAMPRSSGDSYWKVGALVTSIPAVIAANVMMDTSDDGIVVNIIKRVFGSAVLGAVFALPGALIGKQFRKN